jgi:hypothetical protein
MSITRRNTTGETVSKKSFSFFWKNMAWLMMKNTSGINRYGTPFQG